MRCDVCQKNDATVYLTQIVEGKMQKVNLCEHCAKEKGVSDPTGFAMADLLLGLGATQQIEHGGQPAQKCPVCGFTQIDFKKTGRLGCSACYDTFADGLANLLKGMHKGLKHTGKMPAHLSAATPWPTGSKPLKPICKRRSKTRNTRMPRACAMKSRKSSTSCRHDF